ncbi:hypothetical protein NE865_13011 [Phthorimaea operculella]|nr:hypothetical protein NE865_13011 [Phthorimaea operculella]
MRQAVALLLCMVAAYAADLQLADTCDESVCKLPACRCSSSGTPGGFAAKDVPQFVILTFEDAVDEMALDNYMTFLYNRKNSNGCPAGVTLYQTHEYTDYSAVNELYNQGFEIGLHSMAHRQNQKYWQDATYEVMVQQFADQRKQLATFANIPIDAIKGIRIPDFQLCGNNSYLMIKNNGLEYDSSWTTKDPDSKLWPYTLDYASTQDCPKGPCPSASLPGVWVAPLVPWKDLSGESCLMINDCKNAPDFYDHDAWYDFIVSNFERHYNNERTPFGIYARDFFLTTYPAVQGAISSFLDKVSKMKDAFVVNTSEVIEWVKNPISVVDYRKKNCKLAAAPCKVITCEYPNAAENADNDYHEMNLCSKSCPKVFPWLGNPLGQ